MANHKSAKKRIRSNDSKRLANRYFSRTMRNSLKEIRLTSDKSVAEEKLPKVTALIDKLAKKGIIHKNKAANIKSGLAIKINHL
ncbi:MAG: 30S ribosomal protein S20 [Bacteroidales bacterium]|jgi:small subunit ribosomal protein S20|nr:30S ribosomal protein S20 [Bacteroidales bacterium]